MRLRVVISRKPLTLLLTMRCHFAIARCYMYQQAVTLLQMALSGHHGNAWKKNVIDDCLEDMEARVLGGFWYRLLVVQGYYMTRFVK